MHKLLIGLMAGVSLLLLCGRTAYARGFGGVYDDEHRPPLRPVPVHAAPAVIVGHGPAYRPPAVVVPPPRAVPVHVESRHAARYVMPTDAGFIAPAAPARVVPVYGGHRTAPMTSGVAAARAVAVREAYHHNVFTRDWYAAHRSVWSPRGWAPERAWTPTPWPRIAASFRWNAAQPAYYDYGNTVTYQANQVYYGGQPTCTAQQYYQQAGALARTVPVADPNAGDWTPLGVFAFVEGNQTDTNKLFQLAVNGSGAIGGNYTDVLTGTVLPIRGAVDRTTQRAAFVVGDNTSTVYDTGIYNLTQEQAPILVHAGPDITQQWMLVRLSPQG